MRRCLLWLGLVLLAAPALGQPRPGGPPPGAPPAGDRLIVIVNRASEAITTLFMSSSDDTNWGANRLNVPNIAPGRTFQLRQGGRECKFDVQAVYADKKVEEKREVDICRSRQIVFDGREARLPVDLTERRVTVINGAPRPIRQVFIVARGTNDWGRDVLARGEIDEGEEVEVVYRGVCAVNLRVVFDNESAEERHGLDICERPSVYIAPGWTMTDEAPASAADLPRAVGRGGSGTTVNVENRTGSSIYSLFIYPSGSRAEGDDLLGSDTLDVGRRLDVQVDRGSECRFDVRVVFEGTREDLYVRGVDLCAQQEIVLEDGQGAAASRNRPPSGASGPIPAGQARLRNAREVPVLALFADPPGMERSIDRLGDDTIDPGAAIDLAPPVAGQCRYALFVLYRNGQTGTGEVDLCSGQEIPLP